MDESASADIARENAALESCAPSFARLMRALRLREETPTVFLLEPLRRGVPPFCLHAFDQNNSMFWLGEQGSWALPAKTRLEGDEQALADVVTALRTAFPKGAYFLKAYIYRSSVMVVRHITPLARGVQSVLRLAPGPIHHPVEWTPLAKAVRATASTLREGGHVMVGATPDLVAAWSAHERLAFEEFRLNMPESVRAAFDATVSRPEVMAGFWSDTLFVVRREGDLAVLRAEAPGHGDRGVLAVADLHPLRSTSVPE